MPNEYDNPLKPAGTPYGEANRPKTETQFYDTIGSGSKALTAVPNSMLGANEAVYFRSDDRETAEIFADGFKPRDAQGIVYRLMKQDIHPHTAVCVTGSFESASLFPVKVDHSKSATIDPSQKEAPEETRVYVVAPKILFNTQDVQARFAANIIRDQGREQVEMAQGNLYGEERAAPKIDREDIIGAFTVKRTWSGSDYTAGGSYTVTGYEANPNAHDKYAALHDELREQFKSGKLATSKDLSETAQALVEHYKDTRNPREPVAKTAVDGAQLESLALAQRTARETADVQKQEAQAAWNRYREQHGNQDPGIDADAPVTVRRFDKREAFLAEVEKFELRMAKGEFLGSGARRSAFDTDPNTKDAQTFAAYKNGVIVGWMTAVPKGSDMVIEKICSDGNPAHDHSVGEALVVAATNASLAAGKGGGVALASADTLKLASTDGQLATRVGFATVGDTTRLFPNDPHPSDPPRYPHWESVQTPLGTYTKKGVEEVASHYVLRTAAGTTIGPDTHPTLTPAERPPLFHQSLDAIKALERERGAPLPGVDTDEARATVAASLAAKAHASHLQIIDAVVMGKKQDTLFAVQGDPRSEASTRVDVNIGVAMMEPMERSLRQLAPPAAPQVDAQAQVQAQPQAQQPVGHHH
ncbi:MAG: XVIPCD domain-containing protein [Lysobacteraceae bacterium]